MELKSNAKINIGLHVLNKRKDGFHNIATVFQEINLFDINLLRTSSKILSSNLSFIKF